MSGSMLKSCLLLLFLAYCVSCYRSHVPRGGSYSLPPGVNPTFPGRNQGLPPAYHGKFKRSLEGDLEPEDGGVLAVDEPAEYLKVKRSVEDIEGGFLVNEEPQDFETLRARRDVRIIRPTYRPGTSRIILPTYRPGGPPKYILPTYRPGPRQPPKTYFV